MKKYIIIIASIIFIIFGYFKGMGIYSATKKMNIGVKEGKLQKCGEKPNCVSTENTNEQHSIQLIQTKMSLESIIELLKKNGLKLISTQGNYAHFTYTSSIMGYVDDIEIMLNEDQLSIRSASRVGHSDLGANRKRAEFIRQLLN